MRKVRDRAADAAEERILDALLPPTREVNFHDMKPTDNATRQKFRKMLREGQLDDKEIDVEVSLLPSQMEIMAPPGMEDLTSQLQGMFQQLGSGRRKLQKMKIADALKALTDEEAGKLLNDDEIKARALVDAEQNGIVFLDEIDKIASRSEMHGADVSRQGVQRDLLPLVEGTTVTTKYGTIRTDHVLFIASGAFHLSKPSDLIPELQGRFPIRVELDSLSVADFEQILTATDACLTRQYAALMRTENVDIRVHRRRHAPARGDRVRRQREAGEHRRAPALHGDGAAARRHLVPCDAVRPADGRDRRGATSTSAWPASPATTTCRATSCDRAARRHHPAGVRRRRAGLRVGPAQQARHADGEPAQHERAVVPR